MDTYKPMLEQLRALLTAGVHPPQAVFEVFGAAALDPVTARIILADLKNLKRDRSTHAEAHPTA